MQVGRTLLLVVSIAILGCGSSSSITADAGNTIVTTIDGSVVLDGAHGDGATHDAATHDAAMSTVADAAQPHPDASLEQMCNAHTASCESCWADSGCFWCNDDNGCHTQYSDFYFSGCVDINFCAVNNSPDGGTTHCDANGTYVGSGGADSCCSKTIDATGKCTAAPPSGDCNGGGVCTRDTDCGSGFCAYTGDPVGCCMPNTPGCGDRSCASDNDCPSTQWSCLQGCCAYHG
jgi:hypothetical protein